MFQIKTEISFVGWMNMRGIAETTAAFTLYSFQRISCSYRTTFPEELNVYLTSTCCCILPVLFPRVSRLKAEKQRCKIQPARPAPIRCGRLPGDACAMAGTSPPPINGAQRHNRAAADVIALLSVHVQRPVAHALADGPHVVEAGNVHAVRGDNLCASHVLGECERVAAWPSKGGNRIKGMQATRQ